MTQDQRNAMLSLHVSNVRDLLTQLSRGMFDDCDLDLLGYLEAQVDDLKVALDILHRAFH